MSTPAPLARLEQIIDRSRAAARIEALLPVGARPRQLLARTLLTGMLLTQADHRPAHLTRVHQALTGLPETDQIRLGVVASWKHGPHLLTYRQVERTFHLVVTALAKDHPDGAPSPGLAGIPGTLLEASIPPGHKNTTRALAVDWSDLETFSRPPPARGGDCADPEASWGHRRGDHPGQTDELFYGYYISAGTMVTEEHGPAVPELARRTTLTSCRLDPARAMIPVLERMPADGIPLGDILDDSGYAHRVPGNWAVPLRAAGAQLIQDLHPDDRGPHGTHHGAVISNGNLYCPATPPAPARTRPARPRRHRRADHRPRLPDRRDRPLQARQDHRQRHRRLPPRHVPRRPGQAPLPATARIDVPGLPAAPDPRPAPASPRLLHPADHHRPP